MDKKTEGESAYSDCADGKARGEGQRRVFRSPPAPGTRSGSIEAIVQKSHHDET